MRSAGVSVETLIQYIQLFEQGEGTETMRRQLLIDEREKLKNKIADMNAALEKLNYKIDVYYKEIIEKEKAHLNKKGE